MSAWDFWVWGVALPVTLAGLWVHYLPRMKKNLMNWLQNMEQLRFEPSHLAMPAHCLFSCVRACLGRVCEHALVRARFNCTINAATSYASINTAKKQLFCHCGVPDDVTAGLGQPAKGMPLLSMAMLVVAPQKINPWFSRFPCFPSTIQLSKQQIITAAAIPPFMSI